MKPVFITCVAIILICTPTGAGAATNEELAELGEDALESGRFEQAVRYFETLIEQGATFEGLFAVKFDLAWAYYMVGRFEEALPLFDGLSGDRAPSEGMREQSRFMMAEVLARLAEALPESDAGRKEMLDRAIALHTGFQKDNPRHENFPESLYGRAAAFFLKDELGKAARDLDRILSGYATSSILDEARFLLASVYSRRAIGLLESGEKANAAALMAEARKLYDAVVDEGGSGALAAGGMYSAAETWFEAGAYREAIRFFQEIPPREGLLRSLKSRIATVREERSRLLAQAQDAQVATLRLGRYQSEFRRVEESPDWAKAAFFKIAESYVALKRYDEARTVSRHLLKFTEGDVRQQAWYLIVNAYLAQRLPDEALAEFTAFQEELGYDVEFADTAGLAIGQMFLLESRFEEALVQLEKSLEEYPQGQGVEEATHLKGVALYSLNQFEAALAFTGEALADNPSGRFEANLLYFNAMSAANLSNWDASLAAINRLLVTYPEGTDDYTTIDEAFFQKAWMLAQTGRHEVAVGRFRAFLSQFPDSLLQPEATYYLAVSLDGMGDVDGSHAMLREFAAENPTHEMSPVALYQIAVSYYQKEDFPGMATALQVLLERYPENPIAADAWFWTGWIHRQNETFDEAVDAFRRSLVVAQDGELAPEAAISMAIVLTEKADSMGVPTVLPDEKRMVYRDTMMQAAETYRQVLARYPGTPQAMEVPEGIANVLYGLVRTRQKSLEEAVAFYAKARSTFTDDVSGAAFLQASLGSFLMKEGSRKPDALAAFRTALRNADGIRLPPALLSSYAGALKDAEAWDEAESVYERIIEDYADDERAVAPALFGLGDIRYRQDDFEGAKAIFERVLAEYPWFEEGKEGRVQLAKILERSERYTEAEAMFTEVWKQERGEPRIGAMLGVSRCQIALAEAARKSGQSSAWQENVRVADENLTKVIVLYEAYPEYVAEALWHKGRIYELNGEPEAARTNAYEILVERYPDSPWAKRVKAVK
jgi:TolA-binding protein